MADPLIRALLDERVGYVARHLADRVTAVDDELRRIGGEPPQPAEEAVKQPPERPGGARPAGARQRGRGKPDGETR